LCPPRCLCLFRAQCANGPLAPVALGGPGPSTSGLGSGSASWSLILMRVRAVTAWPTCAAVHACSPALPGSLPQWSLCQCFASCDPHSVYGLLGSCNFVCLDDCAMTLVSLRSPAMLLPLRVFQVCPCSVCGSWGCAARSASWTMNMFLPLCFSVIRAQCTASWGCAACLPL